MKYHFTQVRMAIPPKLENNKCYSGYGEKGTLLHCWWNVNWCSYNGEQYGGSLKKVKKKTNQN